MKKEIEEKCKAQLLSVSTVCVDRSSVIVNIKNIDERLNKM